MLRLLTIIFLLFSLKICYGQSGSCGIVANVNIINNSICEPCSYTVPQILINELMISPNTGYGSLSGPAASGGRG